MTANQLAVEVKNLAAVHWWNGVAVVVFAFTAFTALWHHRNHPLLPYLAVGALVVHTWVTVTDFAKDRREVAYEEHREFLKEIPTRDHHHQSAEGSRRSSTAPIRAHAAPRPLALSSR